MPIGNSVVSLDRVIKIEHEILMIQRHFSLESWEVKRSLLFWSRVKQDLPERPR